MFRGGPRLILILVGFIPLLANASTGLSGENFTSLSQQAGHIVTAELTTVEQTESCTLLSFQRVNLLKGPVVGPRIKLRVKGEPYESTSGHSCGIFEAKPGTRFLLFLNSTGSGDIFELCDSAHGAYLVDAGGAVWSPSGERIPWTTVRTEIEEITKTAKPTGIELSIWGKIKELFR